MFSKLIRSLTGRTLTPASSAGLALALLVSACDGGGNEFPDGGPNAPLFTIEDLGLESMPACDADEDCGSGLRCEPRYGRCVECLFDVECGEGEACEARRCVSGDACTADTACEADPASRTHCDPGSGRCVGCLDDAQCGTGEVCDDKRCAAGTRCVNSLDCPEATVCDRAQNLCVACLIDADCGETGACFDNMCRTTCTTDLTCVGGGGLCATGYGFCVECVEDEDCPSEYHCGEGSCRVDTCAQGESSCIGASLNVCRTDGRGFASVGCSEQQATCVIGTQSATCEPWACTPSSATCDAATNERVVCASNGLSIATRQACGEDALCVDGACVPRLCTPNASFCEGDAARVCNAFGTDSTLLGTCTANQRCVVDGAQAFCQQNACTPGVAACMNGIAGTCDPTGSALEPGGTDCEAMNAACNNGVCVPRVCTPSTRFCSGTQVRQCNATGLSSTVWQNCYYASQTCVEMSGTASCASLTCTPGAQICEGTRLATCNPQGTGLGAPYTECEGFADTCDSGQCRPSICTPNAYFCEDDRLMRCNANGARADVTANCGGTYYCDAQMQTCRPDVCTANVMGCSGNATAMCNFDGSGFVGTATPCGAGTSCSNGACVPQTCVPGTRRCSTPAYYTYLYECAPSGLYETTLTTCYSSTLCSVAQAGCVTPTCNVGQTRCNGGRVETCAANRLSYVTSNDCIANQQLCVSSVCVAQQLETIGTSYSTFTAENALRGHYVEATQDRLLIRVEASLRITNGQSRTLTWVVYESLSQAGPYAPIAQITTTANGNGTFQWYGSDPLNTTLRAGRWYAIGVHGAGAVEFGYENTSATLPLSFGNVWSGLYENALTVPATMVGESRATRYLQRLTIGAPPP